MKTPRNPKTPPTFLLDTSLGRREGHILFKEVVHGLKPSKQITDRQTATVHTS